MIPSLTFGFCKANFAAKMALQNPKVREGIKKVAIKSYKKAKPILEKNIEVAKKTSKQKSPFKNFKNYD